MKPLFTAFKTTQENTTAERLHQVIYIMIVAKNISYKVFNYIDPCDGILSYIEWVIKKSITTL